MFADGCSDDTLMTAVTDISISIQAAAAPNITSQVFGSGLIGLREGLRRIGTIAGCKPGQCDRSNRRGNMKRVHGGFPISLSPDHTPGCPADLNIVSVPARA